LGWIYFSQTAIKEFLLRFKKCSMEVLQNRLLSKILSYSKKYNKFYKKPTQSSCNFIKFVLQNIFHPSVHVHLAFTESLNCSKMSPRVFLLTDNFMNRKLEEIYHVLFVDSTRCSNMSFDVFLFICSVQLHQF